jgi:hypothetical protein
MFGRILVFGAALLVSVFCFLPVIHTAASTQEVAPSFIDVDPAEPNLPFINYLVNRQIVAGFPDGSYRPAEPLTRAQAAALMVRAAGLETGGVAVTSFSDVAADHWAFQVIGAAERAGYLKGFPDGTFRPDKNLTRAQGTALVLRLAGGAGVPEVALPPLNDVGADHWAADAVAAGLDAGMVVLHDAGRFDPEAPFTRSSMARALALGVTLSPDTREAPLVGRLVFRKGTVELKKAGATDYRIVENEQLVGAGDRIRTGAGSRAEILFDDGTGLLPKADVQMGIEAAHGLAYIQKAGRLGVAVDRLELDLQRGKMFFTLSRSHGTQTAVPSQAHVLRGDTVVLPHAGGGGQVVRRAVVTDYQPAVRFSRASVAERLPWWKQPRQKRVRLQIKMPFGVAGVRGTVGYCEVFPDGRSEITNFTGDLFARSGLVAVELRSSQFTSITGRDVVADAEDMTPEQLAEYADEEVSEFLESQAEIADEYAAVELDDENGYEDEDENGDDNGYDNGDDNGYGDSNGDDNGDDNGNSDGDDNGDGDDNSDGDDD